MTNPYAPPRAIVRDIADPSALAIPAERGTRLGASILNGIIFAAMVYMPMLFGAMVSGATAEAIGESSSNPMAVVGLVVAVIGFIVWFGLTIMYMARNGQSIGKKLLGIKVVRTDGSPVSLGRLIGLRGVVNGLISILPLYALVDALFIFGESRQCLHDRIADTVVINA
jgi:uncharacterized RDD family membrane protein YckC